MSMTMSSVVVRVDGKEQTYDRNEIKKIILVERVAPQQLPPAQSAPAKSH